MEYKVTNVYGIQGGTTHRTPNAALKAASKREGGGWTVYDENGDQWDRDFDETPRIVRAENER